MNPFADDPQASPFEQLAKDVSMIRYYVGVIAVLVGIASLGGFFVWLMSLR
jgi:hypothetical protein